VLAHWFGSVACQHTHITRQLQVMQLIHIYTHHTCTSGHSTKPRLRTCLVCPAAVAVVSNHMSWADILIQMARYFPAFVARDGTQNLPMIGLIRWGLGDNDILFECMIWERQPVMIAAQESAQDAEPAHDRAH
jgi:hypothetical protein